MTILIHTTLSPTHTHTLYKEQYVFTSAIIASVPCLAHKHFQVMISAMCSAWWSSEALQMLWYKPPVNLFPLGFHCAIFSFLECLLLIPYPWAPILDQSVLIFAWCLTHIAPVKHTCMDYSTFNKHALTHNKCLCTLQCLCMLPAVLPGDHDLLTIDRD